MGLALASLLPTLDTIKDKKEPRCVASGKRQLFSLWMKNGRTRDVEDDSGRLHCNQFRYTLHWAVTWAAQDLLAGCWRKWIKNCHFNHSVTSQKNWQLVSTVCPFVLIFKKQIVLLLCRFTHPWGVISNVSILYVFQGCTHLTLRSTVRNLCTGKT